MSEQLGIPEKVSALDLTEVTTQLVCAYVSNNTLPASELPGLVTQVHSTLSDLSAKPAAEIKVEEKEVQKPAVPIKKSIKHDVLICLECGGEFKSLKKHLRAAYNMSPEEYRLKWGLPADYPMVAPAYAERRSNLAKQLGLGRKA